MKIANVSYHTRRIRLYHGMSFWFWSTACAGLNSMYLSSSFPSDMSSWPCQGGCRHPLGSVARTRQDLELGWSLLGFHWSSRSTGGRGSLDFEISGAGVDTCNSNHRRRCTGPSRTCGTCWWKFPWEWSHCLHHQSQRWLRIPMSGHLLNFLFFGLFLPAAKQTGHAEV